MEELKLFQDEIDDNYREILERIAAFSRYMKEFDDKFCFQLPCDEYRDFPFKPLIKSDNFKINDKFLANIEVECNLIYMNYNLIAGILNFDKNAHQKNNPRFIHSISKIKILGIGDKEIVFKDTLYDDSITENLILDNEYLKDLRIGDEVFLNKIIITFELSQFNSKNYCNDANYFYEKRIHKSFIEAYIKNFSTCYDVDFQYDEFDMDDDYDSWCKWMECSKVIIFDKHHKDNEILEKIKIMNEQYNDWCLYSASYTLCMKEDDNEEYYSDFPNIKLEKGSFYWRRSIYKKEGDKIEVFKNDDKTMFIWSN